MPYSKKPTLKQPKTMIRHGIKKQNTTCERFGAIKLMVLYVEYTKDNYIDEARFNGDISKAKPPLRKGFTSYVNMANFLDKNAKELKNKVTYVFPGSGLPKKCVFDGSGTWVEDHDYI